MSDANVRVIDSNALVAKKMEEHSRLLREREAAKAQTMPEDGDEQGHMMGEGQDPTLDALTGEPIEGSLEGGEPYESPELVPLEPIEELDSDAPGVLSADEVRE